MNIEFEDRDIQRIAERLAEIILPKIGEHLRIELDQTEDELLTTDEAASVLRRSKGQVYQWVHSAQHGLSDFPFRKQGKQLRFSKKALMKWTSSKNRQSER
jgi:excisionase family DNA binding protein